MKKQTVNTGKMEKLYNGLKKMFTNRLSDEAVKMIVEREQLVAPSKWMNMVNADNCFQYSKH